MSPIIEFSPWVFIACIAPTHTHPEKLLKMSPTTTSRKETYHRISTMNFWDVTHHKFFTTSSFNVFCSHLHAPREVVPKRSHTTISQEVTNHITPQVLSTYRMCPYSHASWETSYRSPTTTSQRSPIKEFMRNFIKGLLRKFLPLVFSACFVSTHTHLWETYHEVIHHRIFLVKHA